MISDISSINFKSKGLSPGKPKIQESGDFIQKWPQLPGTGEAIKKHDMKIQLEFSTSKPKILGRDDVRFSDLTNRNRIDEWCEAALTSEIL